MKAKSTKPRATITVPEDVGPEAAEAANAAFDGNVSAFVRAALRYANSQVKSGSLLNVNGKLVSRQDLAAA